MLKCTDLCKTYKPKKGVPVKALDNISLTFPDTGMVFLLGKSGSGKSTLLNVLGGLDRYDSGDVIVKGTSTKKFDQSHFDSYRNTYIGFIFQEYNILEEFTVGANVALAIELQNRPATDEEINRILKEVDLEGYGQRRPNELSGGQKQRVAIARALVKNPEIIFADEPTGALDSNTGKQVFDTLKKLSADHLVVIVSHDREFAEGYADRIIELADGRVIDDVTLERTEDAVTEEPGAPEGLVFDGETITVPAGYHLTEEDRLMINEYLQDQAKTLEMRVKTGGKRRKFVPTDTESVVSQKNNGFHLIKSKLPMKIAFRIGASGLKHKKMRLVFTVLLSLVSFTLFALANTFASYDHIRACTDSLIDSGVTYASVVRSERENYGINDYYYWNETQMKRSEIDELSQKTGLAFTGLYKPDRYGGLDFSGNVGDLGTIIDSLRRYGSRYVTSSPGFVEIDPEMFGKLGYTLAAGRLPAENSASEIAVTKFVYDTFAACGYRENNEAKAAKLKSPQELIGKTLSMNEMTFTVVGVVDTGFDPSRYDFIWRLPVDENDTKDILLRTAGLMEFTNELNYSLCAAIYTGKGFLMQLDSVNPNALRGSVNFSKTTEDTDLSGWAVTATKLGDETGNVIWTDGEREKLADNEVIVGAGAIYIWINTFDPVKGYDGYPVTASDEPEKAVAIIKELGGIEFDYYANSGRNENLGELTVVGVILPAGDDYADRIVLSDKVHGKLTKKEEPTFTCAVAAMPDSRSGVKELVEFCYTERDGVMYPLQSGPTFELDNLNSIFKEISRVFIGVGTFFAIFAAVLFSTFIASSVAYKKQEIGILRAIGSRSNDVFRIFFSESFIIAMINFALAALSAAVIVALINTGIRNEGLQVTVLHFGVKQLLLLFAISTGVAAIASFLPVKKIASKRPVDAIRNR